MSTRIAFEALMALTPLERGRVLCWFCDQCRAYVGPGEACPCRKPTRRGPHDVTAVDAEQCGERSPSGSYRCSLLPGHAGSHAGYVYDGDGVPEHICAELWGPVQHTASDFVAVDGLRRGQ